MEGTADVSETGLMRHDPRVLGLLLCDKTTGGNIRWATHDYETLGTGFSADDEIVPELLTGPHEGIVRPRFEKGREDKARRTRTSAEVFTPSWVCCAQNDRVDAAWFGRDGAICSNANPETGWDANTDPITFRDKRTWRSYVDERVLEVACGEAPYLVSRYDVETGESIPVWRRMGLLDRKLRVVLENTLCDDQAFENWTLRAYEATYGFDLQGDNVLLARENLLATLDEWCMFRNGKAPSRVLGRKVANRIAWNVFQMNGSTLNVPYATRPAEQGRIDLFGEGEPTEPVPALVRDWRACTGGVAVEFRQLARKGR